MRASTRMALLGRALVLVTPLLARAAVSDPCVLVSRAEAEVVLGKLAGDPYRARDDGTADPGGASCFYRGVSGHSFTVHPEYTGGKQIMKMMSTMGGLANQAMKDHSHEADLVEGDWDDQRWSPPGKLSALKGDALIEVDVAGVAGGNANTAGKLANIAVKRLGKPLSYDGAAAARKPPPPLVAPRDPCSLVPAAEAKTILPTLNGAPRATRNGCLYPLAKNGPLDPGDLSLGVSWSGGFVQMAGALAMFKEVVDQAPTQHAKGTVKVGQSGGEVTMEKKTITQDKMQQDLKAVKDDPGYQGMLKQMEGVLGGGLSTSLRDPGGTMRADRIDGPWEQGYIMGGTGVAAVKKDVFIGVDGRGLDIDQARAMVTRAMSKL